MCAACHYAKYGERKKAAQRKNTAHALACQAALVERTETTQAPPTLDLFKNVIRGRIGG